MSEDFTLDEIRPESWDQMIMDAEMYLRKNKPKVEVAAQRLTLPRWPYQTAVDWVKGKIDERL